MIEPGFPWGTRASTNEAVGAQRDLERRETGSKGRVAGLSWSRAWDRSWLGWGQALPAGLAVVPGGTRDNKEA
jgi:hypothetical protein